MEMMDRSRAKYVACLRSETKRVQAIYPSVLRQSLFQNESERS